MLITICSKRLLKLAGWKTFPSYVTASHHAWLRWLLQSLRRLA